MAQPKRTKTAKASAKSAGAAPARKVAAKSARAAPARQVPTKSASEAPATIVRVCFQSDPQTCQYWEGKLVNLNSNGFLTLLFANGTMAYIPYERIYMIRTIV